jgi:glycosyltransferase involved in cell wall biosynthesis
MFDVVFIFNGILDRSNFSGGDRHTVALMKHSLECGDRVRIIGPAAARDIYSNQLAGAEWICTDSFAVPERFTSSAIPGALARYIFRTLRGAAAHAAPCNVLYSGSMLPHEIMIASAWKRRGLCKRVVCRSDQLFHLEPFRQSLPYALHRIATRLGMHLALKYADLVITVNTHLEAQWRLAAQNTGSSTRFHTLSYGIDASLSHFRTDEKRFDVAYLGRLDRVKGADLLPDICRHLWRSLPGTRIVVIGGGVLEKALRRQIESQWGTDAPITWTGNLRGEDRLAFLATAKVMCNPTREDSFSIAVAESLAVGVPVVATDNPHLRAVYGDTLIFSKLDDAEEFANHVSALLLDDNARRQRANQGMALTGGFPAEGNVQAFRSAMVAGS